MNVIVVSLRGPTNLEKRGGAQDYIRFVCKNFDLAKHKVTIICGAEMYAGKLLPQKEIVDGVSVVRCKSSKNRFYSILQELSNHINTADVVVENIMGFPLMLPLFFRFKNLSVPTVAIKHHFEGSNFIRSQGIFKGLIGIFLEEVVQPAVYRNVNFVGVSDLTINKMERAWVKPKLPVTKIPPGIEVDYPDLPTKKSMHPKILYFGAIDLGRKRIDHLIEAFKLVIKVFSSAQLIIGGDGPDIDSLKQEAKNLNVKFTGFISEKEKKDLLQESWLFASPSNSEGFGITWVEANAYGLPVVGYDLGLDTVTIESSVMVKENDVSALSDAIIMLIKDEKKRNKMSLAGQENAKRFDWRLSSEKFQELISKIA